MAEFTRCRNNVLGYPIYGLPYTIAFPILDEDGDPVTGLTCDSEISKNGNTAVDCHNEGVEIAFDTATNKGVYYLDLTGAHTGTEMLANMVVVTIYGGATTAQATPIVLYPKHLPVILTGTVGATGNDTTHAHIPDGAAIDDFYNGCVLHMKDAANDECRMIIDYVASTKLATLSSALDAAPTASTSLYDVYLTDVAVANLLALRVGMIPNAVAGTANGLAIIDGTGAKLTKTVDLTAGQSIACADKTGFSLASTGADLILKSSTFVQAIAAAINELATYGLTALNTLLVTTGIKAASVADDAISAAALNADAVVEINAAVLSAIGGIGSGTGAALNFAPSDDNVDGDIVGAPTFDPAAPFVGVQTSGTFESAAGDDGTYHQIDDATNELDIIYQFSVGAGRNCAKVVFTGYMGTGTADTCLIKAYNFLTGAWDTRSTLIGQNGSTDKVQDITLLAAHTGTGTYAGKVYLRFDSSASNQVLYVDSLIAQAQNLGQTVGYSDGAIWIGGTNANTTPYVDGTADNPCTYAASKTLSASLGLTRFRVKDGVTITLDASAAGKSFIGDNWNLALGGQAIAAAYFYGANVTGVSSGVDAWFDHCVIGTATIAQGFFEQCLFTGTFTTVASGNYSIINGLDGIPGETNSVWVLTANTILGMRNWSGGINLNSMASTNKVVIDGRGKLILDSNCAAGEIRVRGNFDITDNVEGGFAGTFTKTANMNTSSPLTIASGQYVNITRPTGVVVADAGNSETSFKTNLTSAEDDYIKDAYIKFTSGANINQVKKISAYNGTSKVITTAAFTDEPAENDTFVIINE